MKNKTGRKFSFLYFNFKFLERIQEDERIWTEW